MTQLSTLERCSTSPAWRTRVPASSTEFPQHHQPRNIWRQPFSHTTPHTMNLSFFRPAFRPFKAASTPLPRANWAPSTRPCPQQKIPTSTSPFSSTSRMQKRAKKGGGNDPRISTSITLLPFLPQMMPSNIHKKAEYIN